MNWFHSAARQHALAANFHPRERRRSHCEGQSRFRNLITNEARRVIDKQGSGRGYGSLRLATAMRDLCGKVDCVISADRLFPMAVMSISEHVSFRDGSWPTPSLFR